MVDRRRACATSYDDNDATSDDDNDGIGDDDERATTRPQFWGRDLAPKTADTES